MVWFMIPMEKALWPQWNIPSWFIAPMEKVWLKYMVRRLKKYGIKDKMSV